MECPHLKRENYKADITYVTNYEVTFDFLRDNMALNLSDVVLRPLIIASLMKLTHFNRRGSNPINYFHNIQTPIEKYIVAAEITDYLDLNTHYKN
jgi:preprotein translocase subunit SecA